MAKRVTLFFVFALALFVPGAGFSVTSKKPLVLFPTLTALGWVCAVSWSRWVVSETGFYALLIGLLVIHGVGWLWAIWLIAKNSTAWHRFSSPSSLTLALLLFIAVSIASHHYKSDWYGFAFYQIPSPSMTPTLQVGDVILVDTWHYQRQTPMINDIVVFQQTANSTSVLIKRITEVKQGNIFVEGDNAERSIDSRKFGWVDTELLIGRFGFVWFNLFALR